MRSIAIADTDQLPLTNTAQMAGVIRDRAASLGLPLWTCDPTGGLTDEPTEEGTAGIWLRSGAITERVAAAAKQLALSEEGWTQLMPGVWLIRVPIRQRRRVLSAALCLALSHEAFEEEEFETVCASAQMDPAAARRALHGFARHSAGSIESLSRLLHWSASDLEQVVRAQSSVDGFTRQLTNAFETIDLLYALGRSMNEVRQPIAFANLVCSRLFSSLEFGWAIASIESEGFQGRTVASAGNPPLAPEALAMQLGPIARAAHAGRPLLLPGIGTDRLERASQIVTQTFGPPDSCCGFLALGDKGGADTHVSSYDLGLVESAAAILGAFVENASLYARQRQMFLGTVESLTSSIDAKDQYTCGHSRRVALLGARLAARFGLPENEVENVRISGLVHDVGKIGVPEAVLCKAGKLTDEEFELIKQHPVIGYRILKDIPQFEDVLPGVLHHHERYDGRGYPGGLIGDAIPVSARILALADTFDAMSSTRSYRPSLPRERVLGEIARGSGTQFDPALCKVFLEMPLDGYDELLVEGSWRKAAA
ncbi:MAG: HD-GYP domain-containing protein [Planctomycetota bacterium]|nr:HD-GYP domain-containing protein [Planctomycetota bacterium]